MFITRLDAKRHYKESDMSTCPECYEDVGCTCREEKRIAELEAELSFLNAEYKDCPESELTKDALVMKCRCLQSELESTRRAAEKLYEALCSINTAFASNGNAKAEVSAMRHIAKTAVKEWKKRKERK